MKKRHIENTASITWHGSHYLVPIEVMEQYKIEEETLSIEDVFGELIDENGEPGLLLKGLRNREGLTQVKFAELINVTQANLSAMENGKRSIGKEIAKRIEAKFGIDYRLFL
jgi:DNA-binding XRE family transcriptional regulator